MSSLTDLFSVKAPGRLSVKNKIAWYIGAKQFKSEMDGKVS